MKTCIHYLLFLALLAAMLPGCRDNSPEVNNVNDNFVIAGDTIGYQIRLINDTIIPGWQQELKLPVKINTDTLTDLVFDARHFAYQGGTLNVYWSKLQIFQQVEILADTTMLSNDGKEIRVLTPKILAKNDTINSKGVWLKDTLINLSYYIPTLVFEDNGMEIKTSIFNGWNDLGRQYMGYRLLNENDTTYGWLSLQVEHYNKVYIYREAHK